MKYAPRTTGNPNTPGRAWTAAADMGRANSRRIKTRILDQPCPTCGVPTGLPCVAVGNRADIPAGQPIATPHSTRRRLATRADNARRELEGTLAPVEAYDTPTRRPGQGRRHRHWTADEDRVLREAQRAGHDLDELRAELAAQLNRTVAEVKTRRAQLAARGELA